MAKKEFSQGIDAILGNTTSVQEIQSPKKKRSTARTTIIMDAGETEKLKALAFWERRSMREIAEEAFKQYFDKKDESHIAKALDCYRNVQGE